MATTPAAATSSSSRGGSAWPLLIVGLIALVTCIAVTAIQIQTNESFFLHEPEALLSPHLSTFLQPYDFFAGNLPNYLAKAVIWSWISEIVFLICIVGWEEAHFGVKKTWKKLATVFVFVALFIIGFNIYTDYLYGPTGLWTQLGFALAMSVAVVFFGIIGAHFIEVGIGRLKH